MKIDLNLIDKMRLIFKKYNIKLDNIKLEDEYKAYEEINILYKNRILTCVYCGKIYPEGTPTHGSQVLTDHIKVCEKHPLRESEKKIDVLKKALIGLVGVSTKEELKSMELQIRKTIDLESDKVTMLNAIRVLIETL